MIPIRTKFAVLGFAALYCGLHITKLEMTPVTPTADDDDRNSTKQARAKQRRAQLAKLPHNRKAMRY